MPFCQCPVCGVTYHMSVSLDWYRQNWPQRQAGDVVSGECFSGWKELRVGDPVKVRTVPPELAAQVAIGTPGVVQRVENGAEPWYSVALHGVGVEVGRFQRSDLLYAGGRTLTSDDIDAMI
jgi:hypothetical protein